MATQQQSDPTPRKVVVLFSGGRDSSLACCLLARSGNDVIALRCTYGFTFGVDLVEHRLAEIASRFPGKIHAPAPEPVVGLFRRVAIKDIETDFERYKANLLSLGAQLAIHMGALAYCLENDVRHIASGFTRYQSDYPEQRPEAIEFFRSLLGNYDVSYATPVYEYESADEVKYDLLDFGISTKSLEAVSVFGDSGSLPRTETVLSYLNDKLRTCHSYMDLRFGGRGLRT